MPSLPRALSREFAGPAQRFRLTTVDGVSLSGTRVGTADPAIVLCHGFSGWHRKPRPVQFADALARWFTVYGFDFRGHGESEGISTFGSLEVNDIAAVLERARQDGHARVATVGGSMGGIAVIRHGALIGGTDAVVAISTPARWDGHRSAAVRRMAWLTGSPVGRRLMRAAGVRLPETWDRPESPEDLVGKIAPVPLLIVHGRDDHFFDEDDRHTRHDLRTLRQARKRHVRNEYETDTERADKDSSHEVTPRRRVHAGPSFETTAGARPMVKSCRWRRVTL